MCRLFKDSGFEYPSACAVELFSYDSLYTGNISKIIESRSMRWVEQVAGKGEKRSAYRVLVRKSEGEKHLEDTDSDWGMILKCILEDGRAWTGFICLRIGISGGLL